MTVISKPRRLVKEDLTKIGVGATLAGTGAVLTYLVEMVPNVDLGTWQPLVAAVLAVLVNLVRKFVQENRYK